MLQAIFLCVSRLQIHITFILHSDIKLSNFKLFKYYLNYKFIRNLRQNPSLIFLLFKIFHLFFCNNLEIK